MTLRLTLARALLAGSLTAAGLVVAPSPAAADFHIMKVREVSAGTTAEPNADFVELQMTLDGQTQVGGHDLLLYDAAGNRMDCTIPSHVTNGNLNARILFGTMEFEALSPPIPDFTIPPLLHADGGAVCFENIDCVSWGSFTGTTTSPAGTPFPGGIPPDQSIDRKTTFGDTPQDTGDSSNDFLAGTPDPEPNAAGPPEATTCQPGPPPGEGSPGGGAYDLQGLKTKVKGNRARISGQVQPPAPGDRVKLTFFANGSPLRKVAAKSATLNADSKFKKRFKVPGESTRCKVVVRFKGAKLGQRKFKC